MILSEKLKYLNEWTNERIRLAHEFEKNINFPVRSKVGRDVYHVFYILVDNRELFIKSMNEKITDDINDMDIFFTERNVIEKSDIIWSNNNLNLQKYNLW
jgi:dTDP-4-amino-4,6-dideoxygalactose transaminase